MRRDGDTEMELEERGAQEPPLPEGNTPLAPLQSGEVPREVPGVEEEVPRVEVHEVVAEVEAEVAEMVAKAVPEVVPGDELERLG